MLIVGIKLNKMNCRTEEITLYNHFYRLIAFHGLQCTLPVIIIFICIRQKKEEIPEKSIFHAFRIALQQKHPWSVTCYTLKIESWRTAFQKKPRVPCTRNYKNFHVHRKSLVLFSQFLRQNNELPWTMSLCHVTNLFGDRVTLSFRATSSGRRLPRSMRRHVSSSYTRIAGSIDWRSVCRRRCHTLILNYIPAKTKTKITSINSNQSWYHPERSSDHLRLSRFNHPVTCFVCVPVESQMFLLYLLIERVFFEILILCGFHWMVLQLMAPFLVTCEASFRWHSSFFS